MPELVAFGILAAGVALVALWVRLAGTRPQDVADDEPQTLDTRGPDDRSTRS